MTDLELHDSSEFPPVGTWGDEKDSCKNVKDEINCTERNSLHSTNFRKSLSLELFEKDCYFKSYNGRRLSDPSPDVHNFSENTLKSANKASHINKILNLLFMQMVTTEPIDESTLLLLRSIPHKKIEKLEEYFVKVLNELLKILANTINTASESETLEYCGTVLLEVTTDVESLSVVGYFCQALQADHKLYKHAAIALLSSYCTKKKIGLSVIPHLLHKLIFFYIEEDQKVLKYLWKAVNAIIESMKFADQMKILPDVCLAVKFAACCLQDKRRLPGLSHPEGISSILSMYEQAIFKGTMRDKRRAAKALQQVIMFATQDALKPYLCKICGVLIRIITLYKTDTYYWRTKAVIVETLAHLIAKVGPHLKPFFPELQNILLKTLRGSNRVLYLQIVTALSYIVRFYDNQDELYDHLVQSIRDQNNATKERMLHLLRYVMKYSCIGVPEKIRNRVIIIVNGMINYFNESVRIAASACLGTMCGCLQDLEIQKIVKKNFLDDDVSLGFNPRHGRSIALMVALKEAPANLLQGEFGGKVTAVLLSHITSDVLEITMNGIRACGYYMLYKLQNQEAIPPIVLNTFCDTMEHSSEDVNQTFVSAVNFVARKVTLPPYAVDAMVYQLLNGLRKAKITSSPKLKSSCEFALISVLYKDDDVVEIYLSSLVETNARETFEKNILRRLDKLSVRPLPEDEDLDYTNIKQIQLMA